MRMETGRIDAKFQQFTSMRTASELQIDDFSFRCCELISLLSTTMVYTYPLELIVDTMLADLGQPIQDGITGCLQRTRANRPRTKSAAVRVM